MAVSSRLGRYRTISTLGSGGMATVVLAEDQVLGRLVALKRMTVAGDVRGLSRLRREALAGASLSHPNLVSIYDIVAAEDGDQVIVMEYVKGETLNDALNREDRLPSPEALRILGNVATALDAIHSQRIVHRDVKPANILLGADGAVKLADLGIASVAERTQITTAGTILGSFRYMAPEQLDDQGTTPATDVYALSAVAFEVLSGRKARGEDNPLALAHAISTQPPPDLRRAWPEAPRGAAEVLTRGMSRDPAHRPSSASELIGRLRAALLPDPTVQVAAPSPRPPVAGLAPKGRTSPVAAPAPAAAAGAPTRSRRGPVAGALLVLAAAAVVLAVILSGGGSPAKTQSTASVTHGSKRTAKRSRSRAENAGAGAGAGAGAAAASASAGGATAGTTSAAGAPSSATPGSPVSAVESFYTAAASHRYPEAWALADPAFRNQLAGYQSFQSGQAGDRSITFDTATVVSQSGNAATVAVNTTSVRTDGTKRCAGTVDLQRAGPTAGWLLHLIHINCR